MVIVILANLEIDLYHIYLTVMAYDQGTPNSAAADAPNWWSRLPDCPWPLICIRSLKSRHLLSVSLAENGRACAFRRGWVQRGIEGLRSGKIVPTANESICPPYPWHPPPPEPPPRLHGTTPSARLPASGWLHANEPHISAASCRFSTCFLVGLLAFIVRFFLSFPFFPSARVVSCPALDWACYVKL